MPQVILQSLVWSELIEGRGLSTITNTDIALSVAAAFANLIFQLFRLYKESKATEEAFVKYCLNCITARFVLNCLYKSFVYRILYIFFFLIKKGLDGYHFIIN